MNSEAAPLPGAIDARERILATAELLFAQKGVDKTSTRDITAEAGVNVASVNYYFRSKEALTEEIFMRLAQRATVLRLADLSTYVKSATELRLEDLVACFVRPYFEPGVNGALLARFILQHRLHPSEMTRRVFVQYLDPFAMEFIDALCLTDKRVPRLEWLWRYSLMASTVTLAMTDIGPANRMAVLSNGEADAGRGDELKHHLVEFLCRALRSAPPGSR